MISLAALPNITTITQPTELKKGISSQRIEVKLIGADVSRVHATVIPPTFDPTAEIASWEDLAFDEFDLGKISDGKYVATYANFTTPSSYSVVVNGENTHGFSDPVQTTITVPGETTEPEPTQLTSDVNGDGTVNIFYLVIVAGNFGKSLVAAPSMISKIELTTDQKHHIASAIDQLESNSNRSNTEEMALNALKSILLERLPTQTQLLANYPNPFNPETWIPFQLAQDSTVIARIYDVTGKQIITMELGHLAAGNYVESNRAIYWDGKTDTGEQVSSGTYFYQIEAGDYTDTRKMAILK